MKKKKEVPLKFKLLNFVITPAQAQTPEQYVELIDKIYHARIPKCTHGEKKTLIKRLYKNDGYVYGRLMNSTVIKDWYNDQIDDVVDIKVDESLYPNAIFWDFCFVPEAHRMAIYLLNNASVRQIQKFFTEAFKDVVEGTQVDEVHVNVVSTNDSIEKIFSAEYITKLEMIINYTNNDNDDYWAELINNQAQASNTSKLTTIVQGTKKNPILLKKDTLLGGILSLCKENGTVRASGKFGEKTKISNNEYPEETKLSYPEGESREQVVADAIMNKYRANG